MPRTKKQVVEEVLEDVDFENLEPMVEEEPPKKKRGRKPKTDKTKETKKPKKEKYKANPKYKIKEYCDIYVMYLSSDKNKEHLILTFNPGYNNIYVSPNAEFEAIEEMKLFAKHKENKTPHVIFSMGDVRKTENDWVN